MKYLCQSLMLVLSLSLAPLLQAEVYQWTDANGTVHFSSQPRIKGQSKTVEVNEVNVVAPQQAAATPAPVAVLDAVEQKVSTQKNSTTSFAATDPQNTSVVSGIETDLCTKAKQKQRFGQQILDENIDEVGGVKIHKKHVKEMLATSKAQIKQFC
ncbi:DUF4124 domain-containing protein [Motilimonas pumila]|uniref:DUF4124 domain-containing protein n=1 Tax=Motilimonas pumila TaxID=2303987 RepID=A0A418YGV9_9GAMM|nr:DUF4124 domain-containing protein [Motilimonas pumila]RJG49085.1 DUF4124 domain-containing protein [Motilimonas pumila]